LRNEHRRHLQQEHEGKCFWCGRRTKLKGQMQNGGLHPLTATIDHLINSLDRPDELSGITVNACHECNRDRGREAIAAQGTLGRAKKVAEEKLKYIRWTETHSSRIGYLDSTDAVGDRAMQPLLTPEQYQKLLDIVREES